MGARQMKFYDFLLAFFFGDYENVFKMLFAEKKKKLLLEPDK